MKFISDVFQEIEKKDSRMKMVLYQPRFEKEIME